MIWKARGLNVETIEHWLRKGSVANAPCDAIAQQA